MKTKRILISLGIIGVVAAAVIGGTIAYFNDTETSTGNIFTAGSLDLKVDHVWQTYNDTTCNTCDLTLISDESNMVVKKNGVPVTSYPAVFVGSNGGFIHSAWTAQNDPQLIAASAEWIWEDDPTKPEDTTQDVTYTFKKTFDWYGPILSSDLWFAVGSDNSIKIWLNGYLVAENPMEFGYQQAYMLHIPAAVVTSYMVQGTNVLTFEVKNWALPNGTPYTNPAGLIYKFYISGDCQDNYFKEHCTLFGEKDLEEEDTFFNFEDVKPGDRGTNIISLHVYDNDAWSCLIVHDVVDEEDTVVDPEIEAGDNIASTIGELSGFITMFAWEDTNQNNSYDGGDLVLLTENSPFTDRIFASLIESNTKYIGIAWCAGTQSVTDSTISCDGSTMGDIAQTDIMTASLTAYVEQQRNNSEFDCDQVNLEE